MPNDDTVAKQIVEAAHCYDRLNAALTTHGKKATPEIVATIMGFIKKLTKSLDSIDKELATLPPGVNKEDYLQKTIKPKAEQINTYGNVLASTPFMKRRDDKEKDKWTHSGPIPWETSLKECRKLATESWKMLGDKGKMLPPQASTLPTPTTTTQASSHHK